MLSEKKKRKKKKDEAIKTREMKTNDQSNKTNKFTRGIEDYLKPDGSMLQLITRFLESTPSQLQAIIASPWRGSRYRVLNVPL